MRRKFKKNFMNKKSFKKAKKHCFKKKNIKNNFIMSILKFCFLYNVLKKKNRKKF